jgi:hypothetical protein
LRNLPYNVLCDLRGPARTCKKHYIYKTGPKAPAGFNVDFQHDDVIKGGVGRDFFRGEIPVADLNDNAPANYACDVNLKKLEDRVLVRQRYWNCAARHFA